MEVTILGSGTATPRLDRNSSGLAVRTDEALVLVDIGAGTIRRLCEAGVDLRLVDAILITHFHPDHVSDLVPFLFASNYAFGPVRKESFHVVGPDGLEQFYSGLVRVYQDWIVPKGDRLRLKQMSVKDTDRFHVKDLAILSTPSVHGPQSLSYRLEAAGVSVTVSGDTDFSERLIELARGADLLISECSLPDALKIPGHLVPSEAGRIAAEAGVRKLVLTHMYPPCDEEGVDVVAQAAGSFSGTIVKAEDHMTLRV